MNSPVMPNIPREELWFIACNLAIEIEEARAENSGIRKNDVDDGQVAGAFSGRSCRLPVEMGMSARIASKLISTANISVGVIWKTRIATPPALKPMTIPIFGTLLKSESDLPSDASGNISVIRAEPTTRLAPIAV